MLSILAVAALLVSCTVVYVYSDNLGWMKHIEPNRFIKAGSEPVPLSLTPTNSTVLSTESLPTNRNYMPEVGNGHIATVVHTDSIFMNGLYNGANFTSHRARIPSTSGYSINTTSPAGLQRLYSLDIGRGVFFETYTGEGVTIILRTYVHRELTRVLVSELVMRRDNVSTDVEVTVDLNKGEPSVDVDFSSNDTTGIVHGLTIEAEYPDLAPRSSFFMLSSPSLEGKIKLTPGRLEETYLGLTVIDVDRDVVLQEYNSAVEAFKNNSLLTSHVQQWNSMWQRASIDVEGDLHISRINYASLYYILSSLPWAPSRSDWPFIGLSPGGLAHGAEHRDYLGHIFWDQDVWMFPPIALFYPDLGRIIAETRARTLSAAKILASENGSDGARYPWESGFTGLETCPAKPYPEFEIHINGDIPLMVQQYWQLTHDQDFLFKSSGADMVWETAKFWSSRVTYNETDDTYRILGVMPPDEYNFPVNNSAYTNSIARVTLKFANDLNRIHGLPENVTWSNISKKLYLPYDKNLDYHPEFDGFSSLQHRTKQADVVLLSFPLMVEMSNSTRANDLTIYEATTPLTYAPAMTWGMFLLGWLDLENEIKAAELFTRSILNVQKPFYVWSENADGSGAVNFLTGMAGYLQSVLFGYGGIRLYDNTMNFNPKLINGTTKITFSGISYRGCTLSLQYTSDMLKLTLTSVRSGSVGLEVKFEHTGQWQKMVIGETIETNRQRFQIRSSELSLS
ncbi:hypothetical protein BsWGS_10077 [Bradybaena similaris]